MNKISLTQMVFEPERWEEAIDKAELKNISHTKLRKLCSPETRIDLYLRILSGKYEVSVFHIAEIPKDDGGVRKVWVAEDEDRVFLSIVNDCLMELFRDFLISDAVKSYLSGVGCQETVVKASNEISKTSKKLAKNMETILKLDLRKYFDTVKIEYIDFVFDLVEKMLGYEKGTEPTLNVLRKLYHRNLVFDENGELVELYGSLMQGCAISGFLADVVLYDVDERMKEECKFYVRYSDDMLICDKDIEKAKRILEEELPKYGVALHPKKCEKYSKNDIVTFLGFSIRGRMISLSKNRTKKFTKEIRRLTIDNPNITKKQAIKNVKRFMYGDGNGYSWATACYSAMRNNEKDMEILNNYVMDCIRLCEVREQIYKRREAEGLKVKPIIYGKADIGGIGIVKDKPDRTMERGTGKKVKTGKERTAKEIENYKSMGCLLGCYKIGRPVYDAVVRGI